jgi:glycosyltransferase involved in cell wall biosynthesis
LLEAMSAGLPIVATDIKGVRGTARHGKEALLVPAGNEEELAKALIQISRDKELAESLGQMARQRVREVHGCDRMSESLRHLYLGLGNKERNAGWARVLTSTLTNCPSAKGPL